MTLAETVDQLIARGIVLQGEVAIAVAGTDLVRLDLSAVLRAVVRPPGETGHTLRRGQP
ncbi:MAG: gas vesicle protein [Rhodobacteraceae bacterium]|nr:gas vesicle protein [Paracoccaceae bacterium]